MENATRGIVEKPACCSVSSLLQLCGCVKSVSCFLLKHLQKLGSHTQECCGGMLWRTGRGAQGSEWRKQSRAALSLPLGHPAGVAGESSTRGWIAQGQGWTGLLFPFKEVTKGRKPLAQAESWRMRGTKQSDWCCSRPRTRLQLWACGMWRRNQVIPYKIEYVISEMRGRKKTITLHLQGEKPCTDLGVLTLKASQPAPILQSPGIKQSQHWVAPQGRKHQPQSKYWLWQRPNGPWGAPKLPKLIEEPPLPNALHVSMRHKPPLAQGVHVPACSEQVRKWNSNEMCWATHRGKKMPHQSQGLLQEFQTLSWAGVKGCSWSDVLLGYAHSQQRRLEPVIWFKKPCNRFSVALWRYLSPAQHWIAPQSWYEWGLALGNRH